VRKPKKESDEAEVKVSSKKAQEDNEEISSESDEEKPVQNGDHAEPSSDEEEHETAQEKRIRLAQKYLKEIKRQGLQLKKCMIVVSTKKSMFSEQERAESKDIDNEAIGKRLKEDLLEQAGKLRRQVADEYVEYDQANIKHMKCKEHNAAITSLAISQDGLFLFSASKDCSIVKCSYTKISILMYSKFQFVSRPA